MRERREVVHREAGHDREQQPAPPEPLVDEVLRVRSVVLDHLGQHRPADLGVARLVALDARQHRLEQAIARRRAPAPTAPTNCRLVKPVSNTKLVPTANSIGVGAQQQLVHHVARRDRHPVVGVIEAMRPVELRVPGHQLVHERQRESGCGEARRARRRSRSCARRCARPKRAARRLPITAANSASGSVAACSLRASQPGAGQLLEVVELAQRLAHRRQRALLLALGGDVLGVGRAVGLVPALPVGRSGSQGVPAHRRAERPPARRRRRTSSRGPWPGPPIPRASSPGPGRPVCNGDTHPPSIIDCFAAGEELPRESSRQSGDVVRWVTLRYTPPEGAALRGGRGGRRARCAPGESEESGQGIIQPGQPPPSIASGRMRSRT